MHQDSKSRGVKLRYLIKGLPEIKLCRLKGEEVVKGVVSDSRKVKRGYLFTALAGHKTQGSQFARQALRAGALAVVGEDESRDKRIPYIRVQNARQALSQLAERFHGRPLERLVSAAITGTSGKTTTSYLVDKVLRSNGWPGPNIIGTIRHWINGRPEEAKNTTPELAELQEMFARIVAGGGRSVTLEVSSHALALGRIQGMRFNMAIFTNLSREHLDFHKTLSNYFEAKTRLFLNHLKEGGTAIINTDNAFGRRLQKMCRGRTRILTYGIKPPAQVWLNCSEREGGLNRLNLQTPQGVLEVSSTLAGAFNAYNIMAAVGAGLVAGRSLRQIAWGVAQVRAVPGRFELVSSRGAPFKVLVDYAHKPEALKMALRAARELGPGRLISVFGCGGDRDRGKRPVMGRISCKLADLTLITSDNPRSENPQQIISQILAGAGRGNAVVAEPDRRQAIRMALTLARPGDVVLIAGKGHENYQLIGKEKRYFDDREEICKMLKEKKL